MSSVLHPAAMIDPHAHLGEGPLRRRPRPSPLYPQQVRVPSVCTPQLCKFPPPTWMKVPSGGVACSSWCPSGQGWIRGCAPAGMKEPPAHLDEGPLRRRRLSDVVEPPAGQGTVRAHPPQVCKPPALTVDHPTGLAYATAPAPPTSNATTQQSATPPTTARLRATRPEAARQGASPPGAGAPLRRRPGNRVCFVDMVCLLSGMGWVPVSASPASPLCVLGDGPPLRDSQDSIRPGSAACLRNSCGNSAEIIRKFCGKYCATLESSTNGSHAGVATRAAPWWEEGAPDALYLS